MEERRKFVRIPDSLEISYKSLPKMESKYFYTKNIGQGGICFMVHEFVPKNSKLKIRINFKKISFSFEALGNVRWVKKERYGERYEVGVELISIPPEATVHLINYIRTILKISGNA